MAWPQIPAARRAVAPGPLVFVIAIGLLLAIFGDGNIYIALPTHTAAAGITLVDVGLMQAMNRITRIFINGPYGVLLERLPRRPLMLVSLFFGVLSNVCYWFPGFWPLLLGRVLWGLTWAGIWLGGHAMLFDIADESEYGERTGQLQMGFWVGAGVSSLFSGILTDWLGYLEFFRVSAVLVFFGWLFWFFYLPETFGQGPSRVVQADEGGHLNEEPPATTKGEPPWRALTSLLLHFLNWFIFIGIAGSLWPLMIDERTTVALRTLPLVGELGVSSFTGLLSASIILLVSALAAPLIGRLADRWGRPWALLALTVGLGSATMLLSALGYGGWILLAILLQGGVMSVMAVLVTAQVGIGSRARTGRRLGLLNISGDLGGALGPLLAFALLPHIGLEGILALAALLVLAALPLVSALAWREARSLNRGSAL